MRILIVDDVASMRHFLTMSLAGLGDLKIDQAENGLIALKQVTHHRYNLVLLDIQLPQLDGIKVLQGLRVQDRAFRQHTPVLVVTTLSDNATEETLKNLRAELLAKPTAAFDVRHRAAALLGLKSSSPDPSTLERRQSQRFPHPVRVRFAARGADLEVKTQDINALGAFLPAEAPPAVGTQGTATLYFPHLETALEVPCRVVHVRETDHRGAPRGFGIRFEPTTGRLSYQLAEAFVAGPEAGYTLDEDTLAVA